MLLLMVVSLYTSRVILHSLGVVDFGIYNVVGGVVAMFSVLSGSLSAAIRRFITFDLGKGDLEALKKTFSSSVTIQIGLALLFIVLAEFVGVWFLNNKMVIPANRLLAANWVLQFSILNFAIYLISVPYNAAIIAHEKMSAFAYISIIEAIWKLVVAFLIARTPFDRLIFYAFLLAVIAVAIRIIYGYYCNKHFEECHYRFIWDKELLKKMFSFAGWNFLGAGSSLLMNQGVNVLMNLFFTVSINAARGVVLQVDNAILGFVNNFMIALNPQITKNYASNNMDYMYKLVCRGSKYSYFLLFFFALPIMLEAKPLLQLWLGIVPDYSVQFLRLTILLSLLSVISNTLVTSMLATGNIKKYQIIVGGTGMLGFPLAYLAYYLGYPPASVYIINFVIFLLQLLYRLFLLRDMIGLPIRMFVNEVLFKVVLVTVCASVIPVIAFIYINSDLVLLKFFALIFISVICTLISILLIGMKKTERKFVFEKITDFKNKFIKK